jgi:hypothetical protein
MALVLTKNTYSNHRVKLSLSDENGIPYCNVTVNVPELELSSNCVFLDPKIVSNSETYYPDVLQALESKGVLARNGVTKSHEGSFHTFHEAELLELDIHGYDLISEEIPQANSFYKREDS